MKTTKNTITVKVIASYIILSAIALFVCLFLYQQLNQNTPNSILEEKKVINTSAMISDLYEADSYASLSLQSLNKKDLGIYVQKSDSLIARITELRYENYLDGYTNQLDTIANLLAKKRTNIEQLRLIKIANNKDNALDAILNEFEILELNMGRISPKDIVADTNLLTTSQRLTVVDFTEYINSKTTTVPSKVVDSMLTATREIVSSAKNSSIKLRKVLLEKENRLARNDIAISIQLRQIISNLSTAINQKQQQEYQQKNETIYATNRVVKIAGWTGAFLIVLFSYFIISDFFKAQRLKNALQEEQIKTNNVLQSREQLIATVSHDLKTPLTTITGYSQLLQKTNLNTKQETFNNAIYDNTKYISHLAQDLLDFSKLEANKISIVTAPFNLFYLLQKIMNDAIVRHSKEEIVAKVEMDNRIKNLYFNSDARRVEQVITNLISNAFKFTSSGSIILKASLQNKSNQKLVALIKISDSGIGIAPEKLDAIFDPFTQADKEIVKQYGGSGLGLAISKRLATLLGGSLTVKSTLGKGSTFIFSLPLKELKKPNLTDKSAQTFKQGIIIDDDTALLTLLKALFLQLKINVACFSSFTALEKDTPDHFDFILTDMQMPKDDGFTVLQKVKNKDLKSYVNQPIFLMSGDLKYEKEYYLKKGFSDVLAKPFTIEKLIQVFGISEIKQNTTLSNRLENIRITYNHFNSDAFKAFLSDPETIKEVTTLFIEETNTNRETLSKAIKLQNKSLIQATTHKMLTMAMQLEAKKVVFLLQKINEKSRLKAVSHELKPLYKTLDQEITKLIEELTDYLHQ